MDGLIGVTCAPRPYKTADQQVEDLLAKAEQDLRAWNVLAAQVYSC